MTTAQLRAAAQEAAAGLRWAEAADLMTRAVEAYPDNGGALARDDKARMMQRAAGWRYQAEAEAKISA